MEPGRGIAFARHLQSSVVLVLAICTSSPTPARAAAAIELYGTFHSMGIIVNIGSADDPDEDALASVQYRPTGGPYRGGFPLSRVEPTRFVGSLFWLTPGQAYDVRVTLSDPDGGILNNLSVKASASTRPEITTPQPSRTLVVSTAGSGSQCSLSNPCSLTRGIDLAGPGDEVVLRGGVYYDGEIYLPRSGTASAPIVIRASTGETAVLDGADPTSFGWTPQGGGIYRTTVNVAGPHLVVANGDRLYPYQSLSDLQILIWNLPGFFASGTALYVRLEGDGNPNAASMRVSRYNHALLVEQDFIHVKDLTFRHYGQGSYAKAIYLNNAGDNWVRGCTFHINDVGIGIKRSSHRNVIEHNEFRDTLFDWPWDSVKAGAGLEPGGITFYDPTTGRGNVIRSNTFHDYFDGFGTCPSNTAGVTNETDVYGNLIYRAGDDGMSTDGRCSNLRIWRNTFRDVLMGISMAPVYTGPVYAIGNVIYRTGVGNNSYSGSPFKFNSGYSASGPMFLFHNTSDAVLPGNNGLYIKAPGSWTMIYSRNNIWSGTSYALNNYNTSQPVDMDYDDLWIDGGGDLVRWDSARYPGLNSFATATGQEVHGRSASPGWVDRNGGNYSLGANSSLIDAGVLLPGINDGYSGTAPDIGAFEYTGPRAPIGVRIRANQLTFTAGSKLVASVEVANPGLSATLDFYLGAVLPDGDTLVFFSDLALNAAVGSLRDVSTLHPLAPRVDLSSPFMLNEPSFFEYRWTGGEPPGSYILFLAAVVPGGFSDGRADSGDILALSTASLIFTPGFPGGRRDQALPPA